jgi:hypothetical protein
MKQYKILTYKEWEELSLGQQERLANIYQFTFNKGVDFTNVGISVGEMIALLEKYLPENFIIEDSIDIEIDRATNMCFVEIYKDGKYLEFKKQELCDTLWEALKSIL